MSAIIDIAEAVVAEINDAGVLPGVVTAQRHYVPTFELKDTNEEVEARLNVCRQCPGDYAVW